MSEAFEGRVEAGLRSTAWVAVLAATCAACGLLPGWQKAPPVEPVAVATPVVRQYVQVSAAPAFRLIVPPAEEAASSRLLVVNTLVKNVGDVPLEFRPEKARLLLPDGSGGMVFDLPRAQELLRRTIPVSVDVPAADAGDFDLLRSRFTVEILHALLPGAWLAPGQEAHGYIVADMRSPVVALEGIVLEVAATRLSDRTITHGSYAFVPRSAAPAGGEN